MNRYVGLCLVVIFGGSSAVEFSCTNEPIGKTLDLGDVVHVTAQSQGNVITVTVNPNTPEARIKHFAIQARELSGETSGTWETLEGSDLLTCGSGRMLYSVQDVSLSSFQAIWLAPSEAQPVSVEFHLSAMFDDDKYHKYTTAAVSLGEGYDPHNAPAEFEETPQIPDEEETAPQNQEDPDGVVGNPDENPNEGEGLYGDMSHHADELDDMGGEPSEEPTVVDLHDPAVEIAQAREAAERRANRIAEEDANSEGEWSVREEEERRQREQEYDWELREQERAMYEEEQKRQEIILWEIRDKEEHEALLAAETPAPPVVDKEEPVDTNDLPEDEIEEEGRERNKLEDETAGSSALVATALTVTAAFLLARA